MSWARSALPLVLAGLCLSSRAFAQVDEVDPDAVEVQPKKAVDVVDPDAESVKPRPKPPEINAVGTPQVRLSPDGGTALGVGGKKAAPKKAEPDAEPPKPRVAPILVSQLGDAALLQAWNKWRAANAKGDVKAEAEARAELLEMKSRSGATGMVSEAVGMLRAALAHQAAGDATGAIDLAATAVELAPQSGVAHLMRARVFFDVDPTSPGRVLEELRTGLLLAADDPRAARPLVADLFATTLTALVLLAAAVVLVLFLRRSRYFLHDFHHLFPRALARWQSAALAVLLLLTPVVFRMGVATALLVLFATIALYLSVPERVVAWVLISLLGAVPVLGEWAAGITGFAGTPAEQVYLLQQGGIGSEPIAAQVAQQAKEDKASFTELAALATWELRRGKLDQAIERFKTALLKRPNEPRASNNLGVAMMVKGDLDNPKSLFEGAAQAEPQSGVPLYNLGRLYQRRVAVNGASAAGEVDRGNQALFEARQRDPSLAARKDLPPDQQWGNAWLITENVPQADLLALAHLPDTEERVASELTGTVLGDVPTAVAPFYPFAVGGLFFALGFLASSIGVARPCTKCGQAVSRRSDPDLPPGSQMCTQCVNVFAKRGVVPPALKVRKQLEVSRFATRVERASYVLGAVCSGMGHVFTGAVVWGSLYGFLFVFGVVALVEHNGVLRSAYEGPPVVVLLVPLGAVVALVYLLSLRGLFKRAG